MIDTLAAAVEEEGDAGELFKRALYALEHRLAEARGNVLLGADAAVGGAQIGEQF